MLTDDEARAFERRAAVDFTAGTGYVPCRGWPFEHYCIVLIPETSGRVLCYGCAKSRDRYMADTAQSRTSMPTVGDILADLPPIERINVCQCGGDADAKEHAISLLHIKWLAGERHHGR